ncbi:hypothetical protein [Hydrogenimonas sp.]|uniref:hypothetical protein n=1 Tax=Hydrogenimonas sp. TaxID=2231112 RepID=UPI00262F4781|nr:hypothetical protein [Hydrogenimonas sp.]
MKKLMIWLWLLLSVLYSSNLESEIDRKIWKRIIFDLSLKEYRIYTIDRQLQDILCKIPGITLVKDCTQATLIIETRKTVVTDERCLEIPRLSNDYRLLVKNANEIGAFFWMKGRPTIILSKPRLERFGLKVDIELEDYLEDIE